MGLLGKGLLGLLLGGGNNKNRMPEYLRNSQNTYSQTKRYQCIYCGAKMSGGRTPSPRACGPCRNSPYGTHLWQEY